MYRKQTKNQYARDDPAFVVLLAGCIILSAGVISIVLNHDFLSFINLILWLLFVDCIFIGAVVATLAWILANKFLKKDALSSEDVEWGYAFDVHLNAFFPTMIIIQISYLISQDLFIISYSLRLVAVIYYCYITYLGYQFIGRRPSAS